MNYFRKNKQPAIKLSTVNVVEMTGLQFDGLRAFADNAEGNKRAEERFRKLITEHWNANFSLPLDEQDIQEYLDDGQYEARNYHVFLTHSI